MNKKSFWKTPKMIFNSFLKSSRKAQFDIGQKSIWWVIFMFLMVGLIIAFVVVIGAYKNSALILPNKLQTQLIANRFVTSPDCFAYQDPVTKRVDIGTIDLKKFTLERMNDCYQTKDSHEFNYRIKLEELKKEIKSNNFYLNTEQFTLRRIVNVRDGENIKYDQNFVIYVGKV